MPAMTRLPINLPAAGRYLLAVSGGADSMVLLHALAEAARGRGYHLWVGHVDHGLRPDSAVDRQLVQQVAAALALPFSYYEARLPAGASEAAARQARHTWLQAEAGRHKATVVTAHHQDDLLETSLLNLARGSGRRGLVPMQSGHVVRPLLNATRAQIRAYAAERRLIWHDDPTNADLANPRNLLRHRMLPAAPAGWREQYLANLREFATLNPSIDAKLAELIGQPGPQGFTWPIGLVRGLELDELAEFLAAAARRLDPRAELTRRGLDELALFAKTAAGGRRPLTQSLWLSRERTYLRLAIIPVR